MTWCRTLSKILALLLGPKTAEIDTRITSFATAAEEAPSDRGVRAPPRRAVGWVYAAMLLPPLFKLAK